MRRLTWWASLALIFAIPVESSVRISGLGSVARLAGLLVAAFWLATVIYTGKFRRLRPVHFLFIAYVVWQAATLLWSYDPGLTSGRIQTYAQIVILAIIVWDIYTSQTDIDWALQAFVLGAWIPVSSLIRNYLSGNVYGYQRFSALGADPNDIGVILAMSAAMAWYLMTHRHQHRLMDVLRLTNFIFVPATIFAIMLTASRTAFIAIFPVAFYAIVLATQIKLRNRLILVLLLAISLFALRAYIPETSFTRVAETEESLNAGDLSGRGDIWARAIEMIQERPLLGYGSGAFNVASGMGKQAHNVYLAVTAESGLIGLGLFVSILILVINDAIHMPKKQARLWLTLLLIWGIGSLTLNWLQEKQTWLLFAFVVAAAYTQESAAVQKMDAPASAPVETPPPHSYSPVPTISTR